MNGVKLKSISIVYLLVQEQDEWCLAEERATQHLLKQPHTLLKKYKRIMNIYPEKNLSFWQTCPLRRGGGNIHAKNLFLGKSAWHILKFPFQKVDICIQKEKTYIFAHISVEVEGGGGKGVKAFTDMTGKNVILFGRLSYNIS